MIASNLPTYAAMRRRFTVGTRFVVTHDDAPERCNGERVVIRAQGNAIASQRAEGDPRGPIEGGSWCYWPKAEEVTVIDDRTIRIDNFTYELI